MKKTWTNSDRLSRNKKNLVYKTLDPETKKVIKILEAERERLMEYEYREQRRAFRFRHPHKAPKRVHQGRAARLIKLEIMAVLDGRRNPDLALQVLVNEEVEQSRRMAYGNGF